MNQLRHLETEFRRYFPEYSIMGLYQGHETITVEIRDTPKSDPDFVFTMEIGSDDPWYRFVDTNGVIITVPLEL